MCGILGILSSQTVADKLLEGLSRLEYRGYDSAGIATVHDGQIERRRAAGKLKNLKTLVDANPLTGTIGIGHTRWATHGVANTTNAHPHSSPDVAVVHNGIIENFSTLKQSLQEKGVVFESETDTEVVVHLIADFLKNGLPPFEAVQQTLHQLQGAFALVILFRDYPDLMIATRRGSPLVVGRNQDERQNRLFVASDALALVGWVDQLWYLEEGDIAVLEKTEVGLSTSLYTSEAQSVERNWRPSQLSAAAVTKADYSHFMLKEIFEQPGVLSDSIQSLMGVEGTTVHLPSLRLDRQAITQVYIIACGTSYYAGLVAKYWFEKYFQLPTQVEIASEFRYRQPCLDKNALYLFLSQSGETIDTLAALTLVKNHGCATLAIVNVPESSIARQSDQVFYTLAGPEIGVASTKAFTAQLVNLLGLALYLKGENNQDLCQELRLLPRLVGEVLHDQSHYQQVSLKLAQAQHALYLGRGLQYPIALEGALKLKELSYVHAEGYAAGELKHGPIALIDGQMPVVVLAPYDEWFEKTLSNMQEVLARNAQVIILTDAIGSDHIHQQVSNKSTLDIIILPTVASLTSPFVYTVAVQLLAYYAALHKGTDIDQPRNLAKSVTVE
ncbi:glutamine--fructose-6-phosphate transaminase (isomerizing) [Candidatus Finniella inopinata]|uniref:Glutamine--fructose-6-phosphate aminotransferase [isomerizing] n=1 Tax=Candidatus Finniella inopinata TaxID=1696036 RepID=A0A4V2DZS3_9PROT|nr:glutamine--fructose-6-phosphate transaminase (isomerizing) [Candidatus Finniella inopinata]RZI46057.1 glutamine--fructose-6-phosphate transaminase (isomerizing) [Candidatus Finniella inopinata]